MRRDRKAAVPGIVGLLKKCVARAILPANGLHEDVFSAGLRISSRIGRSAMHFFNSPVVPRYSLLFWWIEFCRGSPRQYLSSAPMYPDLPSGAVRRPERRSGSRAQRGHIGLLAVWHIRPGCRTPVPHTNSQRVPTKTEALPLLSHHKSNNVNGITGSGSGRRQGGGENACKMGVFSKRVTLRICRIV